MNDFNKACYFVKITDTLAGAYITETQTALFAFRIDSINYFL